MLVAYGEDHSYSMIKKVNAFLTYKYTSLNVKLSK